MQRHSKEQNYLAIMEDSLKDKLDILGKLLDVNNRLHDFLNNQEFNYDTFDGFISEKGEYISKLDRLDSGFTSVYDRVSEEIKNHKDIYKAEIGSMQSYIRLITDATVKLEISEKNLKELMDKKNAALRSDLKQSRTSNKVAAGYYQHMNRMNVVEPQFMDKKK